MVTLFAHKCHPKVVRYVHINTCAFNLHCVNLSSVYVTCNMYVCESSCSMRVHVHVVCMRVFVQFYFCRFISVTSMASIHPACMYNLKVVSWDYILGLGAQYVHFSRIMCVGLMITTAYTPIRFLSCLNHCHPNHHIYHTHPTA